MVAQKLFVRDSTPKIHEVWLHANLVGVAEIIRELLNSKTRRHSKKKIFRDTNSKINGNLETPSSKQLMMMFLILLLLALTVPNAYSEEASPSISPAPTEPYPPTITWHPTVFPSIEPSPAPTQTHPPTITWHPTVLTNSPTVFPTVSPTCQVLDVEFTYDGLIFSDPKEETTTAAGIRGSLLASPYKLTDDSMAFRVGVSFLVEKGTYTADIESAMNEIVAKPLALNAVGCSTEARSVAIQIFQDNLNGRRQLQDDENNTTIRNTSILATVDNFTCEFTEAEQQVTTCETFVIHDGVIDSETFENRLTVGIDEYMQMMDDLNPNMYPQQEVFEILIDEVPRTTNAPTTTIVPSVVEPTFYSGSARKPYLVSSTLMALATGLAWTLEI